MDLPFLMLVLLLTGIGVIMVFSASYATAYLQEDKAPPSTSSAKPLCRGWPDRDVYHLEDQLPDLPLAVGLRPWAGCPAAHRGAHPRHPHQPFRRREAVDRRTRASEPSSRRRIAKVAVIMYFSARLSKRNTEKPRRLSPRSPLSGVVGFLDRIGFLELVPYGLILLLIVGLMMLEPHMSGTILILAGAAAVLFGRRHQALLVCRRRRRP